MGQMREETDRQGKQTDQYRQIRAPPPAEPLRCKKKTRSEERTEKGKNREERAKEREKRKERRENRKEK